jgi:hypothetical protein
MGKCIELTIFKGRSTNGHKYLKKCSTSAIKETKSK